MGGDSLIEAFWQARQAGIYFPPAYFGKLSIDEAYVVQLGLIERRRTLGERQIGWKVGLTAPAIQQQFGFHEPVFGCVLESKPSGHVFGPRDLIVPGFENELCMRLSANLAGQVSLEDARAAIDVIYPSLEIIETRGPFTEQIALALADNAQQKAVILGAPQPLPADVSAIEAHVSINGQLVATGTGDAVLGNPLNSVVWLAAKLGAYGRCLKAGEIIMTGSFTRQFAISPVTGSKRCSPVLDRSRHQWRHEARAQPLCAFKEQAGLTSIRISTKLLLRRVQLLIVLHEIAGRENLAGCSFCESWYVGDCPGR